MHDKLILELQQADSLESEYGILLQMKEAVLGESDNDILFQDKTLVKKMEADLRHLSSCESKCCLEILSPSPENLKVFLCHLFDRRFGWSEHQEGLKAGTGGEANKFSNKKTSLGGNLRIKSQINGVIDDMLCILMEEKLSLSLLNGFRFAILSAHNKPVVRNRTIIHFLEWVKHSEMEFENDKFLLIKDIVVTALTDVWSVIRNSCVVHLTGVVELFTLQQLQVVFTTLVSICQDFERGWQAREGAVMGISCLIRRFCSIGLMADENLHNEILKSKTECGLKFSRKEKSCIPEFIREQLPQLVYRLLADTQLTVREHAVKAYSLYISRSDVKEMTSSFYSTILQLCPDLTSLQPKLPHDITGSVSSGQRQGSSYHLDLLNSGFQFLDASLAEGLLSLCVHLVKHFPPQDLLSNWDRYFTAFDLYMMHPASTVRQTTSVIFKFIVAKNSSSPAMLKLVLQSLISRWCPDPSELDRDCSHNDENKGLPATSRISVTNIGSLAEKDESTICNAWQWREGRLLAYELIFQFLIKNHWLYTFGSVYQSESDSVEPCGDAHQPSHSFHYSFKGNDSAVLKKQTKAIAVDVPECVETRRRPRSKSFTLCHLVSGFGACSQASQSVHENCLDSSMTVDKSGRIVADVEPAHFSSMRDRFSQQRYSMSLAGTGSVAGETTDFESSKNLIKAAKRRESVSSCDAVSLCLLGRRRRFWPSGCFSRGPSSAENASLLLQCFKEDKKLGESGQITEENLVGVPDIDPLQSDGLHSYLRIILFQCFESLVDSQWELRRMGHQLLPCVVEVIRWYDMSLLTELCDTHFNGKTTLLNYGLSLAVKYSMFHAADLIVMLHCSSHLWQDSALCQRLVLNITKAVQTNSRRWRSVAEGATGRPVIDKITLVAVEILMLDLIHFDSREESAREIRSVLRAIVSIFCLVNSETELARHFIDSDWYSQMTIVPHNGFLSCCAKEETDINTSGSQMEKTFLSGIQAHLALFCSRIGLEENIVLLPVLAFYLVKYASDDGISKALSGSIAAISLSVRQLPSDKLFQISNPDNIQWCLDGLSNLITHRKIEYSSLQSTLDLYCSLMLSISLTKDNVTALLRSVLTRLSKQLDVKPEASVSHRGRASVGCNDLTLLSNDIPSLPLQLNALQTTDDEDEDDDALDHSNPRVMWETQVMSGSGGSNLFGISPRGPAVVGNADLGTSNGMPCRKHSEISDDSDWDNWSQDEEDSDEVVFTLQQFLNEMEANFKSRGIDSLLQQSIQNLSNAEKCHLELCLSPPIRPT